MEKIKSFTINHNVHMPDFYLSYERNGIFTYDLRFKAPNGGDYLANSALHTIEHLFATVIRNSPYKDQVIYFGPMGCRTGFYLLLDDIEYDLAREIVIDTLKDCLTLDAVPGSSQEECGNYKEHDLNLAKSEMEAYIKVMQG